MHLRFRSLLTTLAGLGLGLGLGDPAAALTVSVGQGADCDFPSIAAALDGIGPEVDLTVLVQGRAAGSGQGVYTDALDVLGGRSVRLFGDAGQGLSPCSGRDASLPPRIAGDGQRPLARYQIVVGEGSRLDLENIDVVDSSAGGVRVVGAALFSARRSVFSGHRTGPGVSGAAISLDGADLRLGEVVFSDNASPAAGGAIFCSAPDSALGIIELDRDVVFGLPGVGQGNRAGFDGGAIALHQRCLLRSGDGFARGLRFENNLAGRDGGAIAVAGQFDAPARRSALQLDGRFAGAAFVDNFATRHGGAIVIGSQAALDLGTPFGEGTRPESEVLRLINNSAGGNGGALAILGPVKSDPALERGEASVSASFQGNVAQRGGAVWVDGGRGARFTPSKCDSIAIKTRDRYCEAFEFNRALGDDAVSALGGALLLSGGASVEVDGYALDANDADRAGGLAGRGSAIGLVGGSQLRLANSLLRRNGHDDPDPSDAVLEATTAIDLIGSGNLAHVALSTIAGQRGSAYLRVQAGSSARLVGVIADGNPAGIDAIGSVSGTCNNVQTGAAPAPLDPGFVPAPGTPRGLFRLRDDSLMRARCARAVLEGEGIEFGRDLDGVARRATLVSGQERFDIGAFQHNLALAGSARCVGIDLEVELSQGDLFAVGDVRVEGDGPGLSARLPVSGLLQVPGPGSWADLSLRELGGDRETVALGSLACGQPDAIFSTSFERGLALP